MNECLCVHACVYKVYVYMGSQNIQVCIELCVYSALPLCLLETWVEYSLAAAQPAPTMLIRP